MARTYGKAQDLIDFTRSSGGTALRRVKYGAELVTNGTFDSADGWSLFGGATISGGVLTVVSSGSGVGAQQDILTIGKVYFITVDVVVRSGAVKVQLGSASQTPYIISSSGSYTFVRQNDGTDGYLFLVRNAVCDADFDNISVKEVTFDTSDGDLILFNHPNNIPRIEYDADGNLLGLLVEEQRVNLIPYSEDASQWPVIGAPTITTNIATAPDGTQTVDGIQDVSGDSFERIKAFNSTITANSTVTGSIFVKKETSETNYGGLTLNFTGGSVRPFYGIIDAVNGTIVNPSSGLTASFTVTDVGDFWRFSITATDTGSNTQIEFAVYGTLSSDGATIGTGIGSIRRFWGAQLEAGSFPTSYIKSNSGSTTTRSADVASLSTSAFGYNQDEGTVVVEYSTNTAAGTTRILEIESDANNRITLFEGSIGESPKIFIKTAGITQSDFFAVGTAGAGANKLATAYKTDDIAICLAGGSIATDAGAEIPIADTVLLGTSNAAGTLNGHIKSLKYLPRRLTNTQLQELTS